MGTSRPPWGDSGQSQHGARVALTHISISLGPWRARTLSEQKRPRWEPCRADCNVDLPSVHGSEVGTTVTRQGQNTGGDNSWDLAFRRGAPWSRGKLADLSERNFTPDGKSLCPPRRHTGWRRGTKALRAAESTVTAGQEVTWQDGGDSCVTPRARGRRRECRQRPSVLTRRGEGIWKGTGCPKVLASL